MSQADKFKGNSRDMFALTAGMPLSLQIASLSGPEAVRDWLYDQPKGDVAQPSKAVPQFKKFKP